MTLAHHPGYVWIDGRLESVTQRYRVQRMLRGLMLWLAWAIVATFLAALAAHFASAPSAAQNAALWLILIAWFAWLTFSAIPWLILPTIKRPRRLEVAHLIESRIDGLHNGLTNGLLLARADDLQQSPWLPAILDEIAARGQDLPLEQAVKFSDLNPLALRLTCVVGPLLLAALVPSVGRTLDHGLQQLLHPHTFVPKVGAVSDLQIQPGDVTLITGQALEITATATGDDPSFQPTAHLIFDNDSKNTDLAPAPASSTQPDSTDTANTLRYGYRQEHVDHTLRYRLEVAGTQSPWYTVTVTPDVKLRELVLQITPPPYTALSVTNLSLTPADLDKTPVSVPQGSRVDLTARIDPAMKAAMLQVADAAPTPMALSQGGLCFSGPANIVEETPLSVLLTEPSGQIIARAPAQPLIVHCVKDSPPTIEMHWPVQDVSIAPDAPIKIQARLRDDYGLTKAQVWMAVGSDQPLALAWTQNLTGPSNDISALLDLPKDQRHHGQILRVQVRATDNRDLTALLKDDGGPQTTLSSVFEIRLRDPEQTAALEKQRADELRAQLLKMLQKQKDLHDLAVTFQPQALDVMAKVHAGQDDLRNTMVGVVETFPFDGDNKLIQKTLAVMAGSVAREAVELSAAVAVEPVAAQRTRLCEDVQSRQRRIITTLEALLAYLSAPREPATQPTTREGSNMPNQPDKFTKLDEALKEFIKQEQKILDQSASLAKKPVDNYTDKDRQLLEDLKQAQDKLDAFMQQALSDFSKNAEQDQSNASLIKDLVDVYSEVTMAKDALKQQSVSIAVPAEEMGLEGAKELDSNIQKWLPNTPDRASWSQEDPTEKTDTPMPELPKELEDIVGELMEQQEDLDQQMEDANANWTDSMNKGIGWDALDGPIADMSAKGVTGNALPNDNEMAGRSGEGRSGKSQGEFVGDTAVGKGGRNTPTRLDPTPFAQGQIKDSSKDPVGGATGGGKISGAGAAGLEGPVPAAQKREMERLATKQAELRNAAEHLQLKYHLGRYDNFNLYDAITLMRRNESDLRSNRYANAMRHRDIIVDDMADSKLLLGGTIDVQHDATPPANAKVQQDINDAMKGDLPAAWSEALKEYYKKLSAQ